MTTTRKAKPEEASTNNSRLTDKSERLAQATEMLARRLFQHKTVQEIADEFGMERATVSRRLALARREGVPEEVRNIMIREGLPAAMAVVLEALKSPDEALRNKTAWKMLDGLKALEIPDEEKDARKLGGSDGDSYEVWRERIKVTKRAVDSARGDIIDATRIEALPPGPPASDETAGVRGAEAVSFRSSQAGRPDSEAAEAEEDDR